MAIASIRGRLLVFVTMATCFGLMTRSANAAVIVGPTTSSDPGSWLTDGFGSTGSINYTYATQGALAFVSSGAQSTTAAVQVEWPSPGLGPVNMGTAGGGTVRLTAMPTFDQILVITGIAPVSASYAVVNPADLGNPGAILANKLTVTAGTVMHWIDTNPTLNEQYSFVQVNVANQNNGGAIGAIGFQLTTVPEPSAAIIWSLIGMGMCSFGYLRCCRKQTA